jgi:hypothetical protein
MVRMKDAPALQVLALARPLTFGATAAFLDTGPRIALEQPAAERATILFRLHGRASCRKDALTT